MMLQQSYPGGINRTRCRQPCTMKESKSICTGFTMLSVSMRIKGIRLEWMTGGEFLYDLGRPWREAVISLQNPRLMTLPLEFRLPRNEIWVYRNIHDDAHYLFVQLSRRRPFRIDTPDALIPLNLRGPRNVPILLAWMEDIFGQLAMEHPHYGAVYDAVANYTTLPHLRAPPAIPILTNGNPGYKDTR